MEHLRAVVNANDTFDLQRALQTFNSPVPRNISNADRIPILRYFLNSRFQRLVRNALNIMFIKKKKSNEVDKKYLLILPFQ